MFDPLPLSKGPPPPPPSEAGIPDPAEPLPWCEPVPEDAPSELLEPSEMQPPLEPPLELLIPPWFCMNAPCPSPQCDPLTSPTCVEVSSSVVGRFPSISVGGGIVLPINAPPISFPQKEETVVDSDAPNDPPSDPDKPPFDPGFPPNCVLP